MKVTLPNIFVFQVADGFASHIIKMLMYRMENNRQKSYIVIEDKEKVNKRDIETGNYIDTDEGRSRAQVLSERYGGTFSTSVINHVEGVYDSGYMITGKTHNVFYIRIGDEKTYEGNSFNNMLELTKSTNGVTKGNLYLINAFYNGEDVIVKSRIGYEGRAYGVGDKTQVRNVGYSMSEQYIRNAMAGQLVFNIINTYVTAGMKINYSKIQGEVKKGELKKDYIKGRNKDSITDRVDSKGLIELTDKSYNFDDDFKKFEDKHKEKLLKVVSASGMTVNPKRVLGYAELTVNFAGNSIELAKNNINVLFAVNLLKMKIEGVKKQGFSWTVNDLYIVGVIISYIESKKGTIWGLN